MLLNSLTKSRVDSKTFWSLPIIKANKQQVRTKWTIVFSWKFLSHIPCKAFFCLHLQPSFRHSAWEEGILYSSPSFSSLTIEWPMCGLLIYLTVSFLHLGISMEVSSTSGPERGRWDGLTSLSGWTLPFTCGACTPDDSFNFNNY